MSDSLSSRHTSSESSDEEDTRNEDILWSRGIVWLENNYIDVLRNAAVAEANARLGGPSSSSSFSSSRGCCPFSDLKRTHFCLPDEHLIPQNEIKGMNSNICPAKSNQKLFSLYQHCTSRRETSANTDERMLHEALKFIMEELQDRKEIQNVSMQH